MATFKEKRGRCELYINMFIKSQKKPKIKIMVLTTIKLIYKRARI